MHKRSSQMITKMSLRDSPHRIWLITTSTSLVVLLISGILVSYFSSQQNRTADILGENIGSRKAAGRLEATLTNLIALHRSGAKLLGALDKQVENDLAEIERFADKDREYELVSQIRQGYRQYLAQREMLGEKLKQNPSEMETMLAPLIHISLPACQNLRQFNSDQIDESEKNHRQSLQRMALELVIIAALSSIGGVILGYGIARRLGRQLHQLMVRVSGASEQLLPELSPVELPQTQSSELWNTSFHQLCTQIEQAVSKLQQRDREMRRAEQFAAVGQLAAGVAHEIRNPLTAIKMLIQTTRRDPDAGGLSDEDLDLIEQEIFRLEKTLQSFLDFARPPQLERTYFTLSELVQQTFGLIRGRAEHQRIELRSWSRQQSLKPIFADRGQMQQVLLNLSLNAMDAMPQGGILSIEMFQEADRTSLRIRDTGCGISPEQSAQLFEPFYSGKPTGLGLGLVICKRIIEEHGGKISFGNNPASDSLDDSEQGVKGDREKFPLKNMNNSIGAWFMIEIPNKESKLGI